MLRLLLSSVGGGSGLRLRLPSHGSWRGLATADGKLHKVGLRATSSPELLICFMLLHNRYHLYLEMGLAPKSLEPCSVSLRLPKYTYLF